MIAWLDGHLVEERAPLRITAAAFRCGLGVFETILHHDRRLPRFARHLERMSSSLKALHISKDLPGEGALRETVLEVVSANGLAGDTARVNLFAYQDALEGEASLCVTAMPYAIEPEAVRRLTVYPECQASYLCAHKTMANLHQRLAWEHARRKGFDDAVLVDSDGVVLEASVAALLFSDGHGFFTPRTPFKLPSLTLDAARKILHVEDTAITLGDMQNFRHAYWLNSLGGIQPVSVVDGVVYEPDWDTCRPLLRQLLGLDESR